MLLSRFMTLGTISVIISWSRWWILCPPGYFDYQIVFSIIMFFFLHQEGDKRLLAFTKRGTQIHSVTTASSSRIVAYPYLHHNENYRSGYKISTNLQIWRFAYRNGRDWWRFIVEHIDLMCNSDSLAFAWLMCFIFWSGFLLQARGLASLWFWNKRIASTSPWGLLSRGPRRWNPPDSHGGNLRPVPEPLRQRWNRTVWSS